MLHPAPAELVRVRYLVDDVRAAVDFYTTHLDFSVDLDAAPAFAAVVRGPVELLLSGPKSSAGRPMPDGATPEPGGWNRIQLVVEDISVEVERLREAGVSFRNEVISGPAGQQGPAAGSRRQLRGTVPPGPAPTRAE
ncbi:VOC family protein [Mycobacterium interjectum]|uniref:VOC family protein n=1 Tax=Mycobacterium interjectum TaxID=33895 RepID=UPI000A832084|nr:VOC family protein [Mycobacterium interjectum]